MSQRERIERTVRDELPGYELVLYRELSQPVRYFGHESGNAVRLRIEDRSRQLLPSVVIMDPDGFTHDKLRRILRLVG